MIGPRSSSSLGATKPVAHLAPTGPLLPPGSPWLAASTPQGCPPRTWVRVQDGGHVVAPTALLAEMSEGLNIASRWEPISGVYSAGFSACTAVILRSGDMIALAHTSEAGDILQEEIEEWVALFRQHTNGEVSLTLGVSPAGMRIENELQREHGRSLDQFLDDQEPNVRAAVDEMDETASEDERWEQAISVVLENLMKRTHHVAAAFPELHVQVRTLPHAAVLVPVIGDGLVLFEAEPTEQAL